MPTLATEGEARSCWTLTFRGHRRHAGRARRPLEIFVSPAPWRRSRRRHAQARRAAPRSSAGAGPPACRAPARRHAQLEPDSAQATGSQPGTDGRPAVPAPGGATFAPGLGIPGVTGTGGISLNASVLASRQPGPPPRRGSITGKSDSASFDAAGLAKPDTSDRDNDGVPDVDQNPNDPTDGAADSNNNLSQQHRVQDPLDHRRSDSNHGGVVDGADDSTATYLQCRRARTDRPRGQGQRRRRDRRRSRGFQQQRRVRRARRPAAPPPVETVAPPVERHAGERPRRPPTRRPRRRPRTRPRSPPTPRRRRRGRDPPAETPAPDAPARRRPRTRPWPRPRPRPRARARLPRRKRPRPRKLGARGTPRPRLPPPLPLPPPRLRRPPAPRLLLRPLRLRRPRPPPKLPLPLPPRLRRGEDGGHSGGERPRRLARLITPSARSGVVLREVGGRLVAQQACTRRHGRWPPGCPAPGRARSSPRTARPCTATSRVSSSAPQPRRGASRSAGVLLGERPERERRPVAHVRSRSAERDRRHRSGRRRRPPRTERRPRARAGPRGRSAGAASPPRTARRDVRMHAIACTTRGRSRARPWRPARPPARRARGPRRRAGRAGRRRGARRRALVRRQRDDASSTSRPPRAASAGITGTTRPPRRPPASAGEREQLVEPALGQRGSSRNVVSAGSGRPRSQSAARMGRAPGGRISVSSARRRCGRAAAAHPRCAAGHRPGARRVHARRDHAELPSGSGTRAPMCGRSAHAALLLRGRASGPARGRAQRSCARR